MKSLKIACIGIAVQDRIYRVESLPTHGGKFVAQDYSEVGGGPAATAAVAIARLGANVDFIGRVGDDACGRIIIDELNHYGVGTKHVRVISNAQSSQSAILVDDHGERMIINHQSPNLDTDASWLNDIDFTDYAVILADVRWHQGSLKALQIAKKLGIPSILDADLTPQSIDDLIDLTDHIAFSEPALQRFTNLNDTSQALSLAAGKTQGQCYVTCGSTGCLWIDNAQKLALTKGFSIKVVDTTGAGDVFHGALALAIAEHQTINEAIYFANGAAALKCTKAGGRAGIPTRAELEIFLESARNN
ncbi:6-deoxy-6-sulphofructose kinase [Gammaproteobacteria bacterium]|nr:6-deoxy-6-sulphofructose kinase [Gammaproteobacteria bacterium]